MQELKKLKNILDQIVDKKFPIGNREWCVECAKRIRKEILEQWKI